MISTKMIQSFPWYGKLKNFLFVFGVCRCFLWLPLTVLMISPLHLFAGEVLKVKSGPPPGFSDTDLDIKQRSLVSVYVGGQFLFNAQAVYDLHTIKFSYVKQIVKKLPVIKKDVAIVTQALSKSLSQNGSALCSQKLYEKAQPYCRVIQPKVAGVIFNRSNYRVDLFINPKYLKIKLLQHTQLMPSSAGLSYLANNNLSISGGGGNQTISLFNDSRFGHRNSQIIIDSNFSRYTSQGVAPSSNLSLIRFYYNHYNNQRLYQVGMLDSYGNDFLGNQNLLGVSVDNQSINNLRSDSLTASPIDVYLTSQSKVDVFKSGFLIYTVTLPAGKQQLDTTTFPSGAYNVRIVITSNVGVVTQKNQFFTKLASYEGEKIAYHFYTGFLQKNQGLDDSTLGDGINRNQVVLPYFSNRPITELDLAKSLSLRYGVDTMFMTNYKAFYDTLGLEYISSYLQVMPSLLFSNGYGHGVYLDSNFNLGRFSATLQAKKLFGKLTKTQTNLTLINQDQLHFSPVAAGDLYSRFNLSYVASSSLNFGVGAFAYRNTDSDQINRGYSLTGSYNLFSNEFTNALLTLNYFKSSQDRYLSAGVTVNFFTSHLNLGGSLNYMKRPASEIVGSTSKPLNSSAYIRTGYQWGLDNNLSAGVQANHNDGVKTYVGNLTLQTEPVYGDFSYTRSDLDGQSTSYSNYSAQLSSAIALTRNHVGFGFSNGLNTMVMVHVNALTRVQIKVFVDNNPVAEGYTNDSIPVFVQPYDTYKIRIEAQGDKLYTYDHSPKEVTVYQGNVASLHWDLARQIVLFAQIVNPQGKPLHGLLLQMNSEFDTTDDQGYLQAGIKTTTTKIKLVSIEGKSCWVKLPKINANEKILVLKTPLVCTLKKDKDIEV